MILFLVNFQDMWLIFVCLVQVSQSTLLHGSGSTITWGEVAAPSWTPTGRQRPADMWRRIFPVRYDPQDVRESADKLVCSCQYKWDG